MNPQPDSHNHRFLIDALNELHDSEVSLNDFRDKKSKSIIDQASVKYENILIGKVRDCYKKVGELCVLYKIEITEKIVLPEFVSYENNVGPDLRQLGH